MFSVFGSPKDDIEYEPRQPVCHDSRHAKLDGVTQSLYQ